MQMRLRRRLIVFEGTQQVSTISARKRHVDANKDQYPLELGAASDELRCFPEVGSGDASDLAALPVTLNRFETASQVSQKIVNVLDAN